MFLRAKKALGKWQDLERWELDAKMA